MHTPIPTESTAYIHAHTNTHAFTHKRVNTHTHMNSSSHFQILAHPLSMIYTHTPNYEHSQKYTHHGCYQTNNSNVISIYNIQWMVYSKQASKKYVKSYKQKYNSQN